ncbi:hypothetical protein [Rhizobium sp. SG2393]|uniref:hypothetical protein n=1 Tax=Rhizobium sp. SG2393 TaxID=3276279 RepID=UPI00366C416A
MSKTINAALAALVLTTSVITGASAAFASGDYYSGASDTPIFQGQAKAGSGATLAANNGGDGTYYQGVSRDPVDTVATGSIVKGKAPQAPVNKGDYYQGVDAE